MIIRPYTKNDISDVIQLFRKNTPSFFDPKEEKDLINYLNHEIEDYFIVEQDTKVIGAGGINYFPKENAARISWDIIAPDIHGKGIGTQLVQYRMKHLANNTKVESIIVRTSQHTYKFYEKMGFELIKTEKDFWAKNFDLYIMKRSNIN